MKNKGRNLISVLITSIVISILFLSGPANAIDVSLDTPDIDVTNDPTQTFTLEVQINDGEFLPILFTYLIFNDGTNSITCKIDKEDVVSGCSFLTVADRTISDLDLGQNFGYGYGYNSNNNLGYNSFGYGYGYGYGTRGQIGVGSGTITYSLEVDTSKLPGSFTQKTVDVDARVYGGTEDNFNYFKGSSSFQVTSTPSYTLVDPVLGGDVNYNDITLDIPAGVLPADVTTVIIQQVAPVANPLTSTLKILGKTYDFDIDSATKTFSGPIQISLTYTDDELTLAGISDETKILPTFYSAVKGDWETLTIVSRDTTNNRITFETTHFTQFTLLADTSSPPVTETTVGSGRRNVGNIGPGPVTPEVIPPAEEPETLEEETEEATAPASTPAPTTPGPTGFAALTGNVISAITTPGGAIMAIVVVLLVAFASYLGYHYLYKKK